MDNHQQSSTHNIWVCKNGTHSGWNTCLPSNPWVQTVNFGEYIPKILAIFDEYEAYKWPLGSKIDSNQSMKENNDDNQGSSAWPVFVDDCATRVSLNAVVEMLLAYTYSTK